MYEQRNKDHFLLKFEFATDTTELNLDLWGFGENRKTKNDSIAISILILLL